jgi:hypothetical protein
MTSRTGSVSYCFLRMILTLIVTITTIRSRKLMSMCINDLQVETGGALPRRFFHSMAGR